MTDITLTNSQSRANFFQQKVLANVAYWQKWVAANMADVAALDRERSGILRGIAFGLEAGQAAWPLVYELIEGFAPYMERQGHWEVWRNVLIQAGSTAAQLNDKTKTVALSISSARLLQWQARFVEAKQAYRRVIHLARQIDNAVYRARAYSNLGFLYTEQGYWWRAEILCRHALRTFEQLDNLHGRAHTHNHLGVLYTRQGCYELAQPHFEQASTLWQTMGDDHGLMRGYINLGMLYVLTQQPDPALAYLQKALHLAQRLGEETEIGLIYLNIGIAYRQQGEPVQAEANARQSATIFKRFLNSMGQALALDNLGLACLDQGKWAEANSSFHTSLEIWRKVGSKQGELRTMIYILTYEVELGHWPQAAAQLAEVERLMATYGQDPQHPLWRVLLADCRRRLQEGLQGSDNPGNPSD
ncbi:MAG: tetratricopeptide repeat protein [Anaerolineae bacterium]|nr:tetratricopeptide repeat protein [Anaerolineae bacterium]